MSTPRKRLIALLIASTFAIGAGFAATEIAGVTAANATAEEARTSAIPQPVPEALLPPIAPGGGSYRM